MKKTLRNTTLAGFLLLGLGVEAGNASAIQITPAHQQVASYLFGEESYGPKKYQNESKPPKPLPPWTNPAGINNDGKNRPIIPGPAVGNLNKPKHCYQGRSGGNQPVWVCS